MLPPRLTLCSSARGVERKRRAHKPHCLWRVPPPCAAQRQHLPSHCNTPAQIPWSGKGAAHKALHQGEVQGRQDGMAQVSGGENGARSAAQEQLPRVRPGQGRSGSHARAKARDGSAPGSGSIGLQGLLQGHFLQGSKQGAGEPKCARGGGCITTSVLRGRSALPRPHQPCQQSAIKGPQSLPVARAKGSGV